MLSQQTDKKTVSNKKEVPNLNTKKARPENNKIKATNGAGAKKSPSKGNRLAQPLQKANISIPGNKVKTKGVNNHKRVVKKSSNKIKKNKRKLQNKPKSSNKRRNEMLSKIDYSVTDLLPFVKMTDKGYSGFQMKENKYMNIFLIIMQDYPNMSETDVRLQASQWDKFYRTLDALNVKEVGINLPVDTKDNQAFFRNKRDKTSNSIYRNILNENIEDLQNLEDRQNRQSYLFVFANSYEELKKYNDRVNLILCYTGLARHISPTQKIRVLRKLNNPHCYGSQNL